MIPRMRILKPLYLLFVAVVIVVITSSVVPAEAQPTSAPPTNVRVVNGFNPGEAILTWSSALGPTHYRVGCVNMDRDYPRAKASVTGNWRQAFVFVDVDAPNVSHDQATYTLYGLQEGAYHACTVLSNSTRYGQPTWPTPYWQYITVTDHSGACPTLAPAPPPVTGRPLTIAEVTQLVKPAIANLLVHYPTGGAGGGTGFIVRSDGLMVTNRHVVEDAETLTAQIETPDGELLEFTGRVLGKGILADLAAVQLSANRPFNTLQLGDSSQVAYGDEVTAWGFPISQYIGTGPTLTRGIVSAPHRIYDDLDWVQIDADVNPGNSGGPLIDRYGKVIGVNTAGYEVLQGRIISGINLAIASNEVAERLALYETGGPSQATYHNLKWGYGYSMVIPEGWYILGEGPQGLTSQFSLFEAYGGERRSDILTLRLSGPYLDRNSELSILAGGYWNVILPTFAEDWHFFRRVSPPSGVNIGGHLFARMEYLWQAEEEDCVWHEVALVSISSDHPNKPFGFVTTGAVCQEVQATYGSERDSIIRSFRP